MSKQAKILSNQDIKDVYSTIETRSKDAASAARMKVMFGLSIYCGLRAAEIAQVTISMVTNADGTVSDFLQLTKHICKGRLNGRTIKLHPNLKADLINYINNYRNPNDEVETILVSSKGNSYSGNSVSVYLYNLYQKARLNGCSSHSGRRTFCTALAKNMARCGGSLKDLQDLMGHQNLKNTELYISSTAKAKQKLIDRLNY